MGAREKAERLHDIFQYVLEHEQHFGDKLHRPGSKIAVFGYMFEVVRAVRVPTGPAFIQAVQDGRLKPLF